MFEKDRSTGEIIPTIANSPIDPYNIVDVSFQQHQENITGLLAKRILATKLVSLCDKHLLTPNFVGGTRYDKRSKSESSIDQIFSNSVVIDKPVILKTDHSDHYLLKATFYVQNTQQEENDDKCPKDDSVLDLKNLDIDETKNQLWNTDWEAIINHDKPEEMMNEFTKTVRATLLKMVPK